MAYLGYVRSRAFLLILIIVILITATLSSCKVTDPPDSDIEIISKELIEVPGQNPNIDIYKVFYKSDNIKVLTYMTVPKAPGKYPLVVHLHGGYALERKELSHYDFGFTFGFSYMSDEVVYLYPLYRGYLESDGHVQGIAENTRDAENAIKVAISTGSVKPDSVYLLGASIGGGLVLYPDGRHGLADKYQDQRNQEVMQWLHKYGVPQSFVMQ